MKTNVKTKSVLVLLLALTQVGAMASQTTTNRWSVSARANYNIKAKFGYAPIVRTTPNGDLYNYDNGYVLEDISGNAGGLTWYLGYDDSASQVIGNEIEMMRTTIDGVPSGIEMDGSTPSIGAELLFSREFQRTEDWRFGFDVAVSYLPLNFDDKSQYTTTVTTTTDRFAYTATQAPAATPGAPYQGTFEGPSFLINATPASSTTVANPGVVNMRSELEGDLWGLRIGPYMEFPMGEHFLLHCSGGVAIGWLDVDADWQATGAITESGGGRDTESLSGMFLGADLLWRVTEDWQLSAGAEFEYLHTYEKNFGAGQVSLDFTQSLYITLGIARDF